MDSNHTYRFDPCSSGILQLKHKFCCVGIIDVDSLLIFGANAVIGVAASHNQVVDWVPRGLERIHPSKTTLQLCNNTLVIINQHFAATYDRPWWVWDAETACEDAGWCVEDGTSRTTSRRGSDHTGLWSVTWSRRVGWNRLGQMRTKVTLSPFTQRLTTKRPSKAGPTVASTWVDAFFVRKVMEEAFLVFDVSQIPKFDRVVDRSCGQQPITAWTELGVGHFGFVQLVAENL